MKLFNERIYFNSFGELYLGLKKGWLERKEILEYCKAGYMICSNERLVELFLASEESQFEFNRLIKSYIRNDDNIDILFNEDSLYQDFSLIPKNYWKIWELEFLLKIIIDDLEKEQKLLKVESLYSEFNYPKEWHSFLYYMPARNAANRGIDNLYHNLENYVEEMIKKIKNK